MAASATASPSPITPNKSLKSSASPLPKVHSFNAATTTSDQLVHALKLAGGVIIRNFLSTEDTSQIEADVRPHLDADQPWKGDFFPPETRRACGLVGKSRTFAEKIVGNGLWLGVCDSLLSSTNVHNWTGEKNETSTSLPQLNNTIVFSIAPGARNQALHRDDAIHHRDYPAVSEHVFGRDAGIGLFVAGKKATRANGATRFIPGSHLWNYAEGPPKEEQTFYAEMNPGDAFMVLSACFHGGSANTTVDEERLVYSTFFTRGWMRQEENQYLANDIEEIKKLPEWLQERVGYGLSRPFLGWVNLSNPMLVLHPRSEKYGDLW
ncbi:phytanoyl-CoA dioxygenase family protein [Hyaloscypha variabilis F]|uniref:Phytanoyl-CoA dioxygenase family protein n=1 Tax=Hyaloscypha variabilis (strain UAMH 11265 / GT02V1 / F) TaxID=1149755 RepID=A0A2J6R5L0_HYAVF|nr:phytanoyl-CoA dioxygenase family protein [Hyaloscypha variabilis F]